MLLKKRRCLSIYIIDDIKISGDSDRKDSCEENSNKENYV